MDNYQWLPIGKPKIDSLRLLIPLDQVEVNPEYLGHSYTTINDESGQVIDEGVKRRFYDHESKKGMTYELSHIVRNKQKIDVVKIGFSSKVCQSLYFQGIDKHTSYLAYRQLIDEGVIRCSPESFLNARPVDVDICRDVLVDDLDETIRVASELTRPTTQAELGKNVFRSATNKGIEWGKRDKVGRGYQTKQFLKFYAKALELKHNSTQFYAQYIEPMSQDNGQENLFKILGLDWKKEAYSLPENLLRVETTIKNKQHFESYGYEINNFSDLLNLSSEAFMAMLRRPIYIHMTSRRIVEQAEGMKTTDKAYLEMLRLHHTLRRTSSLMESAIILSKDLEPEDKTKRYRLKKKLKELVEDDMANPETPSDSQMSLDDMLISLELIPDPKKTEGYS